MILLYLLVEREWDNETTVLLVEWELDNEITVLLVKWEWDHDLCACSLIDFTMVDFGKLYKMPKVSSNKPDLILSHECPLAHTARRLAG